LKSAPAAAPDLALAPLSALAEGVAKATVLPHLAQWPSPAEAEFARQQLECSRQRAAALSAPPHSPAVPRAKPDFRVSRLSRRVADRYCPLAGRRNSARF
jgi:hypothetical protein